MTETLSIEQAARIIIAGGVIAYPTEAVFGLGCDPFNQAALERLLTIKQRAREKGLIILAADIAQLNPFVGALDHDRWQTVLASWPGPVTWLLPATAGLSNLLCGDHDTIAARVSAHATAAALCRAADRAIVSTSANLAGLAPARDSAAVARMFDGPLDGMVEGEVDAGQGPSEIRDARTGKIIRARQSG